MLLLQVRAALGPVWLIVVLRDLGVRTRHALTKSADDTKLVCTANTVQGKT